MTERYLHPDREKLSEVADLVAGRIAALLDGGELAEVVPIRRETLATGSDLA